MGMTELGFGCLAPIRAAVLVVLQSSSLSLGILWS
jgi:hypothetical protein